ncbi:hypothetical protein Tco_0424277, partial [Tanacetum coccineum]
MHNNIMAAGSRDRPTMLATGRYAQWQSRYYFTLIQDQMVIELRKCILIGPYTPYVFTYSCYSVLRIHSRSSGSNHTGTCLFTNMTPENRAHYGIRKRSDSFDIDWNWRRNIHQMLMMFNVRQLKENVGSHRKVTNKRTGLFGVIEGSECLLGPWETVSGPSSSATVGIQCYKCMEFPSLCLRMQKAKTGFLKDSHVSQGKELLSVEVLCRLRQRAEPLEQVQYDTDDNVFANDIQHFDQSESSVNTCAAGKGIFTTYEITELQCLYLHKVMECDCLAQKLSEQTEFVSKEIYTELLQSFAKLEKHSISLEIALQDCQELSKNGHSLQKKKGINVFSKGKVNQYFEIQDLKAQMQDKNMVINELKKLILVTKGKSVETQFDKPSVVRQPNAQRIPKPSVLGKPAPFSDSLERKYFAKKKSVLKTNENVSNWQVVPTLNRAPQLGIRLLGNTNSFALSTSTGFKKTEVEDHPRISRISNQTKSVTACNDSLNSKSSNVNVVCVTCGKCVFNSNHDACVSKLLNDVNARTNKLNVVPISTRKPKSQANKSIATPYKKTVASESTTINSKSYYRMLYKRTSKEWKWWIAQQCPSAYTWVPKTKKKWVPKVRNESVTK